MKTGRIITADTDIQAILTSARTIAIIGMSPKPDRDSYRVAAYLKAHGYRVIPVRPAQAEIAARSSGSQRSVEIGASVLSETSLLPKYTSISYPLTASFGIARDKGLAVRAAYLYRDEDPGTKTRGLGDTELSIKWNVLPQPEYRNRPGLAILATGIFPTGDREAGTHSVNHWGCRLGLASGSEIAWEDRIIAFYVDGQVAMQDLSDDALKDVYTLVNTGILFPISKYRNLQMLVEFSSRSGKDIINIDGGNFSAVTYGLRLVSEKFNNFLWRINFANK